MNEVVVNTYYIYIKPMSDWVYADSYGNPIICRDFCKETGLWDKVDKARFWFVPSDKGFIRLYLKSRMLCWDFHYNKIMKGDLDDFINEIYHFYPALHRALLNAGAEDGDRMDVYMKPIK